MKANSRRTLSMVEEFKNTQTGNNLKVSFYKDSVIKGFYLQTMELK